MSEKFFSKEFAYLFSKELDLMMEEYVDEMERIGYTYDHFNILSTETSTREDGVILNHVRVIFSFKCNEE